MYRVGSLVFCSCGRTVVTDVCWAAIAYLQCALSTCAALLWRLSSSFDKRCVLLGLCSTRVVCYC